MTKGLSIRLNQGLLQMVLVTCGIVCSGLFVVSLFAHEVAKKEAKVISTIASAPQEPREEDGQVIAELNIPSVAIKVPVLSDCTFLSLERGACHLKESASFGGLGNAAVAGHRDKDFRNLRLIRQGMNIVVADKFGSHQYVVDSTEVVSPENVQVLDIHQRPELTLITCYPFHYIGPAPRRFIVHAHLLIEGRG